MNFPCVRSMRITRKQLIRFPLAYLGDTVYDLYIRTYLVKNKLGNVNTLHTYASSMVNAKAQAVAAEFILTYLSEEEKAIFRRGRNAKSGGVPKKYGSG